MTNNKADSPPEEVTAIHAPQTTSANPVEEASPSEVVKNLTTPLVVELARLSMPLMQVGNLKAGAVLELARAPGEPVDLVVAGKSIGKGELVEIEGELGVRIISLVK